MDEMTETYTVYVRTDGNGNVTAVDSSAFLSDTDGWTRIGEGAGDRYHHAQGNYFEKPIVTEGGAFRYRLVDGAVTERAEEEIAAEEAAFIESATPTTEDRIDALEAAVLEMVMGG